MKLRRGVSLFEMVVVLAVMASLSAIAIPRMKATSVTQVEQWARVLAQDLDMARSRAFSARSTVRATLTDSTWTLYLDDNRDATISETAAEQAAVGTINTRKLTEGVLLGRGLASVLPTDPTPAAPASGVTHRVQFGPLGTTTPLGSRKVIYFTSRDNNRAVRAVEISPAANVRVWRWVDGSWQ
jgi:prepilin-type N-terminal cleavage/methylation domain-containing protein